MRALALPCLAVCLLLWSACTKKEIINSTEHINYVVDSNQVPHYQGVTTIQIENYVNRAYIDFLGREPSQNERQTAVDALKAGGLSAAARRNMVQQLQTQPEYYAQFGKIYMNALMGGLDSLRVQDEVDFLQFLVDNYTMAGQMQLAQLTAYEKLKLERANSALYEYRTGQISINAYFARLIHNYIYDQINMGSENFVVACFEGLFHRLPTLQEKTAGVTMTNGFPAQLLLRDGTTKGDFVQIVTQVDAFYEGLSVYIYRQLLARSPSSVEMGAATTALKNDSKTYKDVQADVAASDEYFFE